MENEKFYSHGGSPPPSSYGLSSTFAMDIQVGEVNCFSEQLQNRFLSLNWENSLDQSVPLESTLSSIVSSPRTSNLAVPAENVVIKELIGRLGIICNSEEISPRSQTLGRNGASYIEGNNSTNNSSYGTPLNSPHKLNFLMIDHQFKGNLAPFSADPGFAERAAKFSCFSNRSFGGIMADFGFENSLETEIKPAPVTVLASDRKLSRISRSSTPENVEFGHVTEENFHSGQITGGEAGLKSLKDVNGRKRKAGPRGKTNNLPLSPKDVKMATEDEDSNSKRCKPDEDVIQAKKEENGNIDITKDLKQTKDNTNPQEPPKDYIHVRARRGQATDSHSLAERVRREKISERMKFLQDLVPGCNKVTGKAVMLDEIINYVQSLQRQVEFLSMKLATVNPRLDFNMETLISKEMLNTRGTSPHTIYPLDTSASTFPYISTGLDTQYPVNHLDSSLRRNLNTQFPVKDGFEEASSQLETFWEDDLQSLVHMGFGQNQNRETAFQPQSFH